MKPMLKNLALIVPIAPGEDAWPGLMGSLQGSNQSLSPFDLIFTGPKAPAHAGSLPELLDGGQQRIAWLRSPAGRAQQMNKAAKAMAKPWLW
ncbi:hypothetical protein E3A20_24760, partial [Planctomyces bekefii]